MTIPKHAMRCLECGVVIWHKDHAVGCRFYKPSPQPAKCQGCGTTLWSGENQVCAGCIIDYDTTGSRFV